MTKSPRRNLAVALMTAAAGLIPAARAAVTDDLVVHLPFDDAFSDATGRGNNGTPVVQPEIGGDLPGFVAEAAIGSHAVRLLEGQHVTLGAPQDLQFGADVNFSVAFWVKGEPGAWTSDPSFISNKSWASGGNAGWIIAAQGNGGWKWNWKASDATRLDTPNLAVIADGAWHHIVVAHDRAGDATFYLDGIQLSTIPIVDTGDIDSFLEYNLGNDGTGRYGFDNDLGARFKDFQMDDVGVWRRALSTADVAEIYGAGLQGFNLADTASAGAFFKNLSPSPGTASAPALPVIRGEIQAGGSAVDEGSVRMLLNGDVVSAEVSQSGATTSVRYAVPGILPAGSVQAVRIEAKDAAGADIVQEWSFTVASYATVPADLARPLDTRGESGFLYRTVWASFASPNLETTIARAEAQLAGTLIDPNTGEPFTNDAAVGPVNGYFQVPVINFQESGNNAGNFPDDAPFPGLEAGDINSFSTEALTWLELAPGFYRLGVNSDDGFSLRTGAPPQDVLDGLVLGSFDGGRGSADTLMDLVVTAGGLYPFRLIHFEGGGGADCEFFSVDPETGVKILVNDPVDARALKAFQTSTGAPSLPFTRSVSPAPGATGIREDDPITLTLVDGAAQIISGSIQLQVAGNAVTPTVTRSGDITTVAYTPTPLLPSDSQVSATVTYGDGTTTKTQTWTFTTRPPTQPPAITGHWDFADGTLAPTVGYALEYPSPAAQAATQFGTASSFGIPGIGGQDVPVLRFTGAAAQNIYFTMRHNAAPNGEGRLVNLWTLILDLHFPENGAGSWFSFGQIDNLDNTNDGELFANFADRLGSGAPNDGGIGIGGQYTNTEDFETYIQRGQWHRVAFAVDMTNENDFAEAVLSKFIDGKKFQDQLRGTENLDGRHALRDRLLLFADEDGESQLVYVHSVQIRNYKMTDADIAALGAPVAAGIPINTTVINPPIPTNLEAAAAVANGQFTLTWTGGTGPFQVQRKASLTDATWTTVATTDERTFTAPTEADAALYQVVQ